MILRGESEPMDVAHAIDELVRMSLVQRATAPDGTEFLDVPLTAALFGRKKLTVSPSKILIENDIEILQDIGPTSATSLKEGISPRVDALFRRVARRISDGRSTLKDVRPVLEFFA